MCLYPSQCLAKYTLCINSIAYLCWMSELPLFNRNKVASKVILRRLSLELPDASPSVQKRSLLHCCCLLPLTPAMVYSAVGQWRGKSLYSYYVVSPFSSLPLSTWKNVAPISQFKDHSATDGLLVSSVTLFLYTGFLFHPVRPISWPFASLFWYCSLCVIYFFQFFSFNLRGRTVPS